MSLILPETALVLLAPIILALAGFILLILLEIKWDVYFRDLYFKGKSVKKLFSILIFSLSILVIIWWILILGFFMEYIC